MNDIPKNKKKLRYKVKKNNFKRSLNLILEHYNQNSKMSNTNMFVQLFFGIMVMQSKLYKNMKNERTKFITKSNNEKSNES